MYGRRAEAAGRDEIRLVPFDGVYEDTEVAVAPQLAVRHVVEAGLLLHAYGGEHGAVQHPVGVVVRDKAFLSGLDGVDHPLVAGQAADYVGGEERRSEGMAHPRAGSGISSRAFATRAARWPSLAMRCSRCFMRPGPAVRTMASP